MRIWGYIVFTLLSLILGFVLALWWVTPPSSNVQVRSTGVLEQVQQVVKLATVEGQFSEIYDYKDFYYYDWSPLRKKALIKVTATVSLGYNLSEVALVADEDEKTILIQNLPSPTILSRDISHEFYDIQEGSFNAFQPEDLNKMQRDIRRLIEGRVAKSSLPQKAEEQLQTLLSGLSAMLEPYEWNLIWEREKRDQLSIMKDSLVLDIKD
jgi:hypothetical protein